MVVFAFDRDWTVDVNPHPRREAVPLEWVRHLAHETDHPVYAIGNQDLAEEAAIPGVVDIVGRHPDDWDEWLGGKQPDGRYEQFPLRRERLALIADLHPEADAYVVVDDLDLSDVAGWDHYHAWEFVPAVERGDIHPDLPWVREPVTDGGMPTAAGITPADASMLETFLDEHADAPGFEITYTVDGTERTRLCHSVSLKQTSLDRPAAAPAVQCTPLRPGADRFTVRVDAIELLEITDPPPELYTRGAETPVEEATGLRRLAETNPEAVRVSSLLALLDRADDDRIRDKYALQALHRVASVRPADCTPAIPILRSLLARDSLDGRADALATLRMIGETDPGSIAPLVDDLVPFLRSDEVAVRREATRCLAAIAEEYPEDVVDGVPALATVLKDRADGLEYAAYALSQITREDPAAVKPVAETLAEVIIDDCLSDDSRLNATSALGRIAGEHPGIGVEVVDDVVTLFEADHYKLRNNALAFLSDVANVHSDAIEPHADAIAAQLSSDDDYTRINASCCIARVAEDFPDSVTQYVDRFVDLLTDDHYAVRKNACWALGHLATKEAEIPLVERASQDENEEVRKRAEWALYRIQR